MASQSPAGLVEPQAARLALLVSESENLGRGPSIYVSDKFPDDVAGPQTKHEDHTPRPSARWVGWRSPQGPALCIPVI